MSDTTYRPTDLQQRYRAILDEAKAGEARVRDSDGTTLLMLPEADVLSLRRVNVAAANLAIIERVVDALEADTVDASDFGEWRWLRVFDAGDLREFVQEIREAIIVGAREGSSELLERQVAAWKTTAAQADDPVFRAILRGGAAEEDFL